MKNTLRILFSVVIIALNCVSNSASAQSSSSTTASATIVTPLSVEKIADLEITNIQESAAAFGAMPVSARRAGKIMADQRCDGMGTVTAASFTISGYANYAYGVTLPTSVKMAVGSRTLTIGTKLNTASANSTLSEHGLDAISIAGTVSVADEQAMAMNTAEEFPVTIIYN